MPSTELRLFFLFLFFSRSLQGVQILSLIRSSRLKNVVQVKEAVVARFGR